MDIHSYGLVGIRKLAPITVIPVCIIDKYHQIVIAVDLHIEWLNS